MKFFLFLLLFFFPLLLFSQVKDSAGFLKDLLKNEGFVDFYWDEFQGKIYLNISSLNQELIYINYLFLLSPLATKGKRKSTKDAARRPRTLQTQLLPEGA